MMNSSERDKLLALATLASTETDFWRAFSILRSAIGPATYRDTIRECLKAGETAKPPSNYALLWGLGIRGIINFNLDSFAVRSRPTSTPALNVFPGKRAGRFVHILREPSPFVAHLHGTLEDESTWIFTTEDLNGLMTDTAYKNFLQTCFSAFTVLFLGVTADDQSILRHLKALKESGTSLGTHYWLTDRTSKETDDLAEHHGLRLIQYTNKSGEHAEVAEFLSDIRSFRPKEETAPPVTPRVEPADSLPSPDELNKYESADDIRTMLNGRAAAILTSSAPASYAAFERFRSEYDEAIYRAWYVTTNPPKNKLLGLTLTDELGHGAFGTVFRAHDSAGNNFAIKVLHRALLQSTERLQSFRRGVRSMQILSARKIAGMVPFHGASEIPAFVKMDCIDGPNLWEAIQRGAIDSIQDRLSVALDLSRIIQTAHALPERVLHRDIRPQNIMLSKASGSSDGGPRIIVLDFDLSWHLDASELSVVDTKAGSGYLAPEQSRRKANESTRSALVDSFGVGMTLYYIFTGRDPAAGEQLAGDWGSRITSSCLRSGTLKCLHKRIARLIVNSTKDEQARRIGLTEIAHELEKLKIAEESIAKCDSCELVAEEIAARCEPDYQWDPDHLFAYFVAPSGSRFELKGAEVDEEIQLKISWSDSGDTNWREVGKWVKSATDKSASFLKKAHWDVRVSHEKRSISIEASVSRNLARVQIVSISSAVASAFEALRFS